MHFNKMTNIAAGLALAASTAGAQAVGVASLTVVEIGGVTGMTMAAATASNSVAGAPFIGASGGLFYFGAEVGNGVMGGGGRVWGTTDTTDNAFTPPGNTTAGQITMGVIQGYGEMSDGFRYGGASSTFSSTPNSLHGAITATWTGLDGADQLALNLSGFGWYWNATGFNYNLSPDNDLVTNVQTIGGVTYYTADWSHVISAAVDPDVAGQRSDWHMEGILTPVPEASTYGMLLVGLGLVGGMGALRRK